MTVYQLNRYAVSKIWINYKISYSLPDIFSSKDWLITKHLCWEPHRLLQSGYKAFYNSFEFIFFVTILISCYLFLLKPLKWTFQVYFIRFTLVLCGLTLCISTRFRECYVLRNLCLYICYVHIYISLYNLHSLVDFDMCGVVTFVLIKGMSWAIKI